MAEELAKAIVLAADAMHRRAEPMRVATVSVGHFFSDDGVEGHFLVRGSGAVEEDYPNYVFSNLEDAFSAVRTNGYVRMNEAEEREWIETVTKIDAKVPGGPKDFHRGKPVMVFFKLMAENEKRSGHAEARESCEQETGEGTGSRPTPPPSLLARIFRAIEAITDNN